MNELRLILFWADIKHWIRVPSDSCRPWKLLLLRSPRCNQVHPSLMQFTLAHVRANTGRNYPTLSRSWLSQARIVVTNLCIDTWQKLSNRQTLNQGGKGVMRGAWPEGNSSWHVKRAQIKWRMILTVVNAIYAIAKKGLKKNSELQRGLNPWPRDTDVRVILHLISFSQFLYDSFHIQHSRKELNCSRNLWIDSLAWSAIFLFCGPWFVNHNE